MMRGIRHENDRCRSLAAVSDDLICAGFAEAADIREKLDRVARSFSRPLAVGVLGSTLAANLNSAWAILGGSPEVADAGSNRFAAACRRLLPPGDMAAPSPHQTMLRLLSQVELIKIIGNSYLVECLGHSSPGPTCDEVDARFHSLSPHASGSRQDDLTEAGILEIGDYFQMNFGQTARIDALDAAGFWQRTAGLAPFLPTASRTDLLGLLWGDERVLSDIYRRLCRTLQKLSFSPHASVETWLLSKPPQSLITVWPVLGAAEVEVDLGELAALTLEIIMPRSAVPGSPFDHAHVVCLPEIPNRPGIGPIGHRLPEEAPRFDFLDRAKAAYLLQAAGVGEDFTALVVCAGATDATDANPHWTEWVRAVIGGIDANAPLYLTRSWTPDTPQTGGIVEASSVSAWAAVHVPEEESVNSWAETLRPILDEDMRGQRMKQAVDGLRAELMALLDGIPSGGEGGDVANVGNALVACAKAGLFGQLLDGFIIRHPQLETRILSREFAAWAAAVPGRSAPAAKLAAATMGEWGQLVVQRGASLAVAETLGLPAGVLAVIAQELVAGAGRLGVGSEIENATRPCFSRYDMDRDLIRMVTRIASETIGRFVSGLGSLPAARPTPAGGYPLLGEERQHNGDRFCRDWAAEFIKMAEATAATGASHPHGRLSPQDISRLKRWVRLAA